MDISTIIDAPASPSTTARPAREPSVSSKAQKEASMPQPSDSFKDLAAAAFKQAPITVPGDTPATYVSRESPPQSEPVPADKPKETRKQQREKPDPKVREHDERLKAAQDVWSKVPVEQSVAEKAADEKPAASTPPPAASVPTDDPFAGVKDGDWKAAKAAAKARQEEAAKRVAELQAEIEKRDADLVKFRQAFPDPTEAEKVRAENKAALERLALLDFKSHPEYRRQYIEPKERIINDLKGVLSDNAIEGVDLEGLLSKPRIEFAKSVAEIQSKMNSFDAQEFHSSMRELAKLDQAGKAAIGNHQQVAEGLRQQSEARARTAFEQAYNENKQWLPRPYEITPEIPHEDRPAIEEFNKGIAQVRANAEKYAFSPSDDKTSGAIAFKAAQFDFYTKHAIPRMVKDYQDAKELIGQMKSELEALKSKRPGVPDSAPASSTQANPKKEEDIDFRERARRVFAGEQI